MVNITAPDLNFTEFKGDIISFSIQGYINILGFFFWPVLFTGIIAYIYLKNQSAVAAVVGVIIIFAGFAGEGIFMNVPVVVMFYQAITALVIAGLFVMIFTRRRG